MINSAKSSGSKAFSPSANSNDHRLMAKILELKAIDCLCADYSKKENQEKLRQALAEATAKSRFFSISSFLFVQKNVRF